MQLILKCATYSHHLPTWYLPPPLLPPPDGGFVGAGVAGGGVAGGGVAGGGVAGAGAEPPPPPCWLALPSSAIRFVLGVAM